MAEEIVIQRDATGAPVPAAGQGTKDDTITLSKSQYEATLRDLQEARQSEQAWANFHRAGGKLPEPAAEPKEDLDSSEFLDVEDPDGSDDTPEKLVNDFASKGVSALKARGFVTAADAQRIAVEAGKRVAEQMIGRERQKMTTDAQIMSEFPELKDQNSELFKATAVRYQKAVAMDANAKKTPAALYLAAEAARESLKRTAPAPRAGETEEEADRRHRAASQDGRTRGRGAADEPDEMLGDEAKQIIKSMGITEAEFLESRKATVGTRGRR